MPSDRPPAQLGNYELLMLLASGGMANIYAARQLGAAGFQRLVVVKRVHAHLLEDREFYDMFRDEASMASLVKHPNVVPVTDVVESGGELFLVMDYVDGVALSTVLKAAKGRAERMPTRVAVRIVFDILAGLHAAHEVHDMRGHRLELVHRDVSPHNIVVGADGISRLIDFGVAKAAHRSTHTRSGALKGKYPYMSPEHASGGQIDRRSDIFAAAAVLHEAITGKRLFQGSNDLDTLRRVMEAPIPEVSAMIAGLPHTIDAVLRTALARNASDRYQTAQDFSDALERAMPPAPHRDVRAALNAFCEDRLVERRSALQAMIEGKLPPLSIRQTRPADEISGSQRAVSGGQRYSGSQPPAQQSGSQRAMGSMTPSGGALPPAVLPPSMPPPPDLPTQSYGSKGTQITHDTSSARPRTASRTWVAGLGLLGAAGLGTLIAVWTLRSPSSVPTHDPATSIGAPPPTPPPPTGATLAADEVELTLVADAPIESVRAQGARDVAYDGTHARLRIAKWSGTLPVDAVLEGGKLAHALVLEGAVGEVHLDLANVDSGGPTRTTHGSKVIPQTTAAPTADLHANPYGN